MECYHPIHIRNPSGDFVVPCGKCFGCQSKRREDFAFRLKEEMKHSICSYTVTLTYDDLHLPPLESFVDRDPLDYLEISDDCSDCSFYFHPVQIDHVQRFIKVLRKTYKLRYFGVGEYGSHSNRPHYHIIFFFQCPVSFFDFDRLVRQKWLYGSKIKVDRTDDSCIEYTLKYCLKPYGVKQPSPKVFCSKNPFIGYSYFSWDRLQYHMHHAGDMTVQDSVVKRLPRIYRRIYTDNMKLDNTKLLQIGILEKQMDYERLADEKGLSYQEFRSQKIEAHKEKVIRSIKKKQL